MSQALYRKYRSKTLAEVIGQDHITRTLDAALKSGKISHAYLFTGPRGVGKTSVARILAHEINGLEYVDDQTVHLDIIEIDAASNRRIDEIRDLRDKVHIAPTSAKYKVYIIDEVHMLTKEAFNALLKTLEEPPAHVVFILATTELQKVPDTIVSRTQRFVFKHIDKKDNMNHLRNIARQEDITIDDEALSLIAEHAAGGFRDAISLLDQIRHYGTTINAQVVADALGVVPSESSAALWQHIHSKDQYSAITQLKNMQDDGIQPIMISRVMTEKAIGDGDARVARLFLHAAASKESKTELLLAVLESTENNQEHPAYKKSFEPDEQKPQQSRSLKEVDKSDVLKVTELTQPIKASAPITILEEKEEKQPEPILTNQETLTKLQAGPVTAPSFWDQVLYTLKESGHITYAPLRLAIPKLEGKDLTLSLDFPFHIKRLQEPDNLKHLRDVISTHNGHELNIIFIKTAIKETPQEKKQTKIKEQTIQGTTVSKEPKLELPNPLSMVQNIFGSAELI